MRGHARAGACRWVRGGESERVGGADGAGDAGGAGEAGGQSERTKRADETSGRERVGEANALPETYLSCAAHQYAPQPLTISPHRSVGAILLPTVCLVPPHLTPWLLSLLFV